jgi:hypothetical protein
LENSSKDGYYRDKESKIQVPLIMFKRNTVTKRRDIGNKLDGNQAHLFQTFEKKYSSKNQYDNFDILNNRSPEKEYHAVVVPDYVTLTYDCIIWTEYVENMNKLVEAINFASDSYWGDPNRWKFKATIDSFQNQTEVTVGGNRIVRTTFTLTLNGYLIPDVYNKALANKTKFSSVTNIKFTDEQFTLQNAQTQPQPAVSTFTTTGPGALSGGGTTVSAFPFTGNAVINGSLTVSGSFVDFTGATAISGSVFSGSFVGDGSGLTGVTAEWDGSHLGDASITGSLTVTGGVSGSFSGSFVGDGSGLTGISTDTNIDKVYYVTPSGSDSTGIVGDLHQPFKTIGAARDKILNEGNSSTTLIHVFPGKYVEDEIQYQNGNFYFEPGAVVISPRRINGNSWGQRDGGITAVDTGNKIFTLGNYDLTTVYDFVSGSRFNVLGSTSNDGQYTIISSSGDSSEAQIFVSESIPSSTANGYIRDTTAIFKIGNLPLHSRLDSLTTDINIYGHGDFLVSQSIDPSAPDWNGSVVEVSSSIANVGFNFENIRAQQGIVVSIQKGTVNLTGKKIECTTLGSAAVNDGSGYSVLLRGTEIFTTINVEEIVSYTSFALYLGNPFGGTAYINSQRITNNEGASTDTPIFIVGQQTGSKVYIGSQVIESNSNALNIQSNVGGELYVKANVNSGTGNNIVCLNNGKGGYPFDFTYEGNNVGNGYGVLTFGPSFSNGGGFTLNHIGKVFSKNSAAINWNGGTLNLTGDIIASGSNKRGVEVYSGDVNFNNTRIISTGDSIYSTSPQTVYAQTPLYIDTPFNSNITVLGQYNYSGSSQHFSGPVSSSVFSGSFVGDGSGLTGIISSSYATTASYVETAQTASYVLNAISSSYSSFAVSASYAVSASHEIIKEVSSSYADTASFAQSGNGIFSGSFSGSFEGNGSGLTDIPASGIVGLNLSQIASGSSTASISPNGGLFVNTNITSSGNITSANNISASNNLFTKQLYVENNLAVDYDLTHDCISIGNTSDCLNLLGTSITASGNISSSGYISASFFIGDGSQLTNLPLVTSASYALTASYVETAQTASYVLNAISSSYSLFAVSASYAVSASHEIIKEVSSSYADTASFAQSGNGIFSGSFSGSYVGDGSGLTGVDPFPFSGSAVITGSLLVSGSSLPLEIIGSGSTVFSIQGSLGELFAIDDQLSGSLLVVNDISGLPQFEVFSDGRTLIGAEPRSLYTTATINATLAATSQSIYSLSTSSYDGVFFDYTVTSASNARAGNIMSIWNGGNLVYTENTTTDIGSTTGVTFNVEISQSQAQLISVTDTEGWKIKTTIRSI